MGFISAIQKLFGRSGREDSAEEINARIEALEAKYFRFSQGNELIGPAYGNGAADYVGEAIRAGLSKVKGSDMDFRRDEMFFYGDPMTDNFYMNPAVAEANSLSSSDEPSFWINSLGPSWDD
ncbi:MULTISPECIES: hypothetical protein [Comamonadaceae]|uniref:Uncharacterized protein n=1 Tax=Simplicispira suum TaxID=2109915 RepID=A0A2S0N5Z5_9BURK|nr:MULTISPECIES: hypothetical protein [Comamonadaceae]ADV02198.1 hypothetical protein Alide_4596 [Alicycliphilus denitrificans BC]AVO43383.1 hypothetical protein C6571_18230 [Simplicispira suum]